MSEVLPVGRADGFYLHDAGGFRFVPIEAQAVPPLRSAEPALRAAEIIAFPLLPAKEKLRFVSRIGEHYFDRLERGELDAELAAEFGEWPL